MSKHMPPNKESNLASESHESGGSKQGGDSVSGRPKSNASVSSSTIQEKGRYNASAISKTCNINSKTTLSDLERDSTSSPAAAAASATTAAPPVTAAAGGGGRGGGGVPTTIATAPQPPPPGAPAVEAAGPIKSADHNNNSSTERGGEFGSSPVAYSRRIFARGYDHRRRGRAYSSTLPPPPPQAPVSVGGGAGWTGLRDLDGYTSSAEADIESMASVASHDSREVSFELDVVVQSTTEQYDFCSAVFLSCVNVEQEQRPSLLQLCLS